MSLSPGSITLPWPTTLPVLEGAWLGRGYVTGVQVPAPGPTAQAAASRFGSRFSPYPVSWQGVALTGWEVWKFVGSCWAPAGRIPVFDLSQQYFLAHVPPEDRVSEV